ncbi:MAG: hypothetical protein M3430_14140 [Acidobacteriota bacterium]|nr:hypothetical protein [Acidobacteriota bacterium]
MVSPKTEAISPLPSVEQILARYVEALGGKDAITRLTSRVARGKVDMPGVSRGGTFEVYAKAPNKSVSTLDVYPIGVIKQGFNGREGWDQTKETGLQDAAGEDLAALERDSDFYSPLRLKVKYPKMTLRGKMNIGYRGAYLIEAQPTIGEVEKLYFEKESGLLIRWDVVRATVEGKALAVVYLDDWRKIDGVRLPFLISQSFPGFTFVLKFEDVKHNLPVDDALFNKPPRPNEK